MKDDKKLDTKPDKKPDIYVAVVGLTNAEEKYFKPGSVVTADDFPSAVFTHWLKIGRIAKATVKEEIKEQDVTKK